jgi:NAD(P)-dependent dehydrogenase (short-subunit alcohol dehydrogenase family)
MVISGSVVIVTGASSGIGLSAARLLTELGAKVALVARSTAALEELQSELPRSFAVTADMTDWDAIKSMVNTVHEHYGRIDGLVNNAGRAYEATIEQIDPDIFEEIFKLNVLGPVVAMQAVIPIMRSQGSGCIVNINSGTAFMRVPGYSVYSSSKRALMGIGLTAREELAKDGIVVSQIYPGITATNFGVNKLVADEEKGSSGSGPVRDYSKGDPPEVVAELIVKALTEGEAEYFVHERMRTMENR